MPFEPMSSSFLHLPRRSCRLLLLRLPRDAGFSVTKTHFIIREVEYK